MLEKKWAEVFVGTMLAPSKTSLKNNHTESILNLNISMIFAMVKSPRCYLQIGWHVIPGCRVRSKFKDRLPRSGTSVSFQLENNPVGVQAEALKIPEILVTTKNESPWKSMPAVFIEIHEKKKHWVFLGINDMQTLQSGPLPRPYKWLKNQWVVGKWGLSRTPKSAGVTY